MEAQSVRCGDTITISANGRTATAVVWDECPPCAWGSLDLSAGLFQYFNDLGVGVFPITWWTGGDPNPPAPPPQTSSQPAWTPDPTPTSTPPAASSADPASSSSADATPTQAVNIASANKAVIQLMRVVQVAGA
ncbi:hypothetical protein FRC17_001153 [Serendipita sp. 399]|nr:hypothetical protein FRC17_001153 [Serendipita sp. 399]